MNMRKRLLSLLTAIIVVLAFVGYCFTSSAKTFQNIKLDVIYTDSFSGEGDMIWYTYTPEDSGTYSFISYTVAKTIAYLYTRSVDENGIMSYHGLAYAPASDPNYLETGVRTFVDPLSGVTYTHSATSFRLTYHLEKGTTYYFAAGRQNQNDNRGEISVRLKCDEYDNTVLQSVNVTSSSTLTWFTDGEWRTDSSGESYYWYDPSKIIQNMTVTITYKDGSTSSVTGGKNVIDGYAISYNYDQSKTHWYYEGSDKYTENIMTVTVGTVSCHYNVVIKQGALYSVQGVVSDYVTGDAIKGATINIAGKTVATTDSKGLFNFGYSPGVYEITIKAPYGIDRKAMLTVSAQDVTKNDHTSTPIPIIIGDYVKDGIINGKDFACALHNSSSDTNPDEITAKFKKQLNFTDKVYDTLQLK